MTFRLNDREEWSEADLFDLRAAIGVGYPLEHVAVFLGRSEYLVRVKVNELKLRLYEQE
jgi:hypothetical protein